MMSDPIHNEAMGKRLEDTQQRSRSEYQKQYPTGQAHHLLGNVFW